MIYGKRIDAFRDKVVWITGASSGIGRSLAKQLHQRSATVILSGRNVERLEAVAGECPGPAKVHVLPMDLTDRESLVHKADAARKLAGRIDCVVHNAGVASRDMIVDTALEVDRQVMETNYFGAVALTKLVLPAMLRRQAGCFVVVSSVAGKYGVPRMGAYSASKHALHGFFESLRSELHGTKIRITIAVPGFIHTPITINALTGDGTSYGRMISAHESGMSADECARRILKAVDAHKQEVIIGGVETLSVPLLRVSRRLVATLVRNHPMRVLDGMRRIGPPWRAGPAARRPVV